MSMRQKLFALTVLLIAFTMPAVAQTDTTFNQTNEKGQKTGWWKRYYNDGSLMYKGYFDEGKPSGVFKRYNPDGNLIAKMHHHPNYTYTELYHENGKIQAKGKYQNQQKDSLWLFFTENGHKINEVFFKYDKKHGLEKKFYRSGQCSEMIHWKNGKKDSTYKQYYPSGALKMKATYDEGKMQGVTAYYHENGELATKGHYVQNLKEGPWLYLSEKGDTLETIVYHRGIAENQDQLLQKETQEILEMEKKEGQIQQPQDNRYNKIPPKDYKKRGRRKRR